jgi:hypothetical protein
VAKRGGGHSRRLIALEAARVMYREGVSEYFTAKRIAARRILGRDAKGARFRPGDLPNNGEIRDALRELATLAEGAARTERLFAMRVVALQTMRQLEPWHPRLIGSVWSGHARRGSDIDLHVFVESVDDLEATLRTAGRDLDRSDVLIRVGDTFKTYTHIHLLDAPFPVELSVYLPGERRMTTRSSTDGKTIDRVSPERLEQRLREEHGPAFEAWEETGALNFEDDAGPAPGEFDGLLASLTT